MTLSKSYLFAALLLASQVHAQAPSPMPLTGPATTGTMVIVPAQGEVTRANDEAVITFSVEEHDKSKEQAADRANRKMKQGIELVRRADPSAELKTVGYYTHPIYPDNPPPQPVDGRMAPRVPVAWRVGQYLEVTTHNLDALQKTAAAAQKVLSISNIQFGLRPETLRAVDNERIAETYRNLNERVVAIARAMGRNVSDAVLETVDFEGSGQYMQAEAASANMMRMSGKRAMADEMTEPSFEPGETTLQMRAVGKVKFK